MAVNSIYLPTKQPGNGVNLIFSGNWKALLNTDFVVQKIDQNGVVSAVLTLNVDYTVVFDAVAETWTITYTSAPVNGGFSLVSRDSNQQQQTVYPRDGNLPARATETALDKLTLIAQEIEVGQVESPVELSGAYASRPAAPALPVYYYSTDRGSYEKWVPAAQRWFLLG